MADLRGNPCIAMGWPDREGRSEVRRRDTKEVIGFTRQSENRYFAENFMGMPLEGTYKTKSDAARVVGQNAGVL